MKAWVTKYALTRGVQVWNGEAIEFGLFISENKNVYDRYRRKGDWWPSRAAAIADAIKRRDRKIASLKKQIACLETLIFEDTPE